MFTSDGLNDSGADLLVAGFLAEAITHQGGDEQMTQK